MDLQYKYLVQLKLYGRQRIDELDDVLREDYFLSTTKIKPLLVDVYDSYRLLKFMKDR